MVWFSKEFLNIDNYVRAPVQLTDYASDNPNKTYIISKLAITYIKLIIIDKKLFNGKIYINVALQ